MIRLLLFSLVALALAALPSPLWGGGNEAHIQLTRAGALSGGEPATEVYEVLSPMKRLQVHLTLHLESGAAEWQLRDPDGGGGGRLDPDHHPDDRRRPLCRAVARR